MKQLTYKFSSASRINDRGLDKPNEDFLLIDGENHFFMLLDGITRVHKEYSEVPGHSAACDVNQLFCGTAHAYVLQNSAAQEPLQLLKNAALAGNAALIPYRQRKSLSQWQFYPGTLGILALLRGSRLYFAYTGDCLGTLIRESGKIYFGQQGTNQILEQWKVSKADRYNIYCNHPEHPLSYGIFNGDDAVDSLLELGYLDLQAGDTVILSTDGLTRYITCAKASALASLGPDEILDASLPYDRPPFAEYADDKALIKLSF